MVGTFKEKRSSGEQLLVSINDSSEFPVFISKYLTFGRHLISGFDLSKPNVSKSIEQEQLVQIIHYDRNVATYTYTYGK